MKCFKSFTPVVIIVVIELCLLQVENKSFAQTTVYHSFTNLDPAQAAITEQAWLVVQAGTILALGNGELPSIPDANKWNFVDMSGTFALPGFIDAHGHITSGPMSVVMEDESPIISMESVDEVTRYHALVALATGITTVRNPAGDPTANARYDARVASGDWIGPDVLHAGFTFDPISIRGNSIYPYDKQAWELEILRQKNLGMSYIKLYTGLTAQELNMGIELAHKHGMKTIAHLDQLSWQFAINQGVDALTHALPTSADLLMEPARTEFTRSRKPSDSTFFYRWFEQVDLQSQPIVKLVQSLAEKNVEVDLTMGVNETFYLFDQIDSLLPESDYKYFHPDVMMNWHSNMTIAHFGWNHADYQRAHAVLPKVLEFARLMYQAGVPLLIGTDGYGGGPSYAQELSLHERAGISRLKVLELATSMNAARLDLAGITGALQKGLEADIVFLSENPLDDIANIRHVKTVVNNGIAYDPQGLLQQALSLTE